MMLCHLLCCKPIQPRAAMLQMQQVSNRDVSCTRVRLPTDSRCRLLAQLSFQHCDAVQYLADLYTAWSRKPGKAAVTSCTSAAALPPAAAIRLEARPPYCWSRPMPTCTAQAFERQ